MCTRKNVCFIQAQQKIWRLFNFQNPPSPGRLKDLYSNLCDRQNKNVRLSKNVVNQISTRRKKKDDSQASEINPFFIDDISMSRLSKVDYFPFVVFSLNVAAFSCPSVTDFPNFFIVFCFNRVKRFDSFPK